MTLKILARSGKKWKKWFGRLSVFVNCLFFLIHLHNFIFLISSCVWENKTNIKQEFNVFLSLLLGIFRFWQDKFHFVFNVIFACLSFRRENRRDLTQSYDKSPYTNRNVKRAKCQHKLKKFDYTAFADRLRTVSRATTATHLVRLTWFTGPTLCDFRFSLAIAVSKISSFKRRNEG